MRRAGFTLMELLLVMALIGIVLGLGALALDRMDPGARAFEEALATFLQTSRDYARSSGQPVVVEVRAPAAAGDQPRLVRRGFHRALEATFEPEFARAEGLEAVALAPGRCGSALDLRGGGSVDVPGRGAARGTGGFAVALDVRPEAAASAVLVAWPELLEVRTARDGGLRAWVRAAAGRFEASTQAGALSPGRWHHLSLVAADGRLALAVDGRELAAAALEEPLAAPAGPPRLGDPEGRFAGLFDEFALWVRVAEEGQVVPAGVELDLGAPRLRFDRRGWLDAAAHPGPVTVEVLDSGVLLRRFRVGRFVEEAAP